MSCLFHHIALLKFQMLTLLLIACTKRRLKVSNTVVDTDTKKLIMSVQKMEKRENLTINSINHLKPDFNKHDIDILRYKSSSSQNLIAYYKQVQCANDSITQTQNSNNFRHKADVKKFKFKPFELLPEQKTDETLKFNTHNLEQIEILQKAAHQNEIKNLHTNDPKIYDQKQNNPVIDEIANVLDPNVRKIKPVHASFSLPLMDNVKILQRNKTKNIDNEVESDLLYKEKTVNLLKNPLVPVALKDSATGEDKANIEELKSCHTFNTNDNNLYKSFEISLNSHKPNLLASLNISNDTQIILKKTNLNLNIYNADNECNKTIDFRVFKPQTSDIKAYLENVCDAEAISIKASLNLNDGQTSNTTTNNNDSQALKLQIAEFEAIFENICSAKTISNEASLNSNNIKVNNSYTKSDDFEASKLQDAEFEAIFENICNAKTISNEASYNFNDGKANNTATTSIDFTAIENICDAGTISKELNYCSINDKVDNTSTKSITSEASKLQTAELIALLENICDAQNISKETNLQFINVMANNTVTKSNDCEALKPQMEELVDINEDLKNIKTKVKIVDPIIHQYEFEFSFKNAADLEALSSQSNGNETRYNNASETNANFEKTEASLNNETFNINENNSTSFRDNMGNPLDTVCFSDALIDEEAKKVPTKDESFYEFLYELTNAKPLDSTAFVSECLINEIHGAEKARDKVKPFYNNETTDSVLIEFLNFTALDSDSSDTISVFSNSSDAEANSEKVKSLLKLMTYDENMIKSTESDELISLNKKNNLFISANKPKIVKSDIKSESKRIKKTNNSISVKKSRSTPSKQKFPFVLDEKKCIISSNGPNPDTRSDIKQPGYELNRDIQISNQETNVLLLNNDSIPSTSSTINCNLYNIWKTLNTSIEDKELLGQIDSINDPILNSIIENEKSIITDLLNKKYKQSISIFGTRPNLAKNLVDRYLKINIANINESTVVFTNQIIAKNCELIDACNIYISLIKKDPMNYNTILISYFTIISDNLINYAISDSFKLDTLIFKINIDIVVNKRILPRQVSHDALKTILINCLKNHGDDFLVIFPEIIALIDFLRSCGSIVRLELKNLEIYKYLYMIVILTNFLKFNWSHIFIYKRANLPITNEKRNFNLQASCFSFIKYEIWKVLLYCITPFVPKERYVFCTFARILEKFCLCINAQYPIKFLGTHCNSAFYLGKFNFIARFSFLKHYNPENIFLANQSYSVYENLVYFVFKNNSKAQLIGSFTIRNKAKILMQVLQRYIKLIAKKSYYSAFNKKLKKAGLIEFNSIVRNKVDFSSNIFLKNYGLDLNDKINTLCDELGNIVCLLFDYEIITLSKWLSIKK